MGREEHRQKKRKLIQLNIQMVEPWPFFREKTIKYHYNLKCL